MGKKGLNYQLTISTIICVVFFLMSVNLAFGQAFTLNPNTLNDQALTLIGSGNYQGALDVLDRALAIDPDHVHALNNKGRALLGLNEQEEAIVWFDKALEVNPNYVHALNNKGNAYIGLDKKEEAIVWFDKTLEVDPNYLYALNNKGFVLLELEQYEEAIVWLDKALEVDPNYVTAQQNKVLAQQNIELSQQTLELAESPPEPESTKENNGGGCLIATATYGSEYAPQVQMLREIRDNSLMKTQSGQFFMQGFNEFYYSFSPTIADYERQNPVFKETVKLTITPLLASLSILNYVEIDSEESVLGFGIGIIMLNIGMYFVAPTLLILRISKKL